MAFNCEVMFKTDCGEFSTKVVSWVAADAPSGGFSNGRLEIPLFEGEPKVYVPISAIVYLKQVAA